mgnify:CR=1 FL=1
MQLFISCTRIDDYEKLQHKYVRETSNRGRNETREPRVPARSMFSGSLRRRLRRAHQRRL